MYGEASSAPLDDLVAAIENKQQELSTAIESQKITLAGETNEHKLLQGELATLKPAAGLYAKAREDAVKARTAANGEVSKAQHLIDELEESAKRQIDAAIAAIDDGIAAKRKSLNEAQDKLAYLQGEDAKAAAAVEDSTAGFAAARASLTKLPNSLGGFVTPLKKLGTDVASAAEAGQKRKVFVLSRELKKLGADMDKLIDDTWVKSLVDKYDAAKEALSVSHRKQSESRVALKKQDALVASLNRELADLENKRKDKLKELYLPPKNESPAKAST